MNSFEKQKNSHSSKIIRPIIRALTSKKVIDQEINFVTKHPIIAIVLIFVILISSFWYYNSPFYTNEYTKSNKPQGSVAGANSKESDIKNGNAETLILPTFFGFRILSSDKYPDIRMTPGTVYQNITEKDVCDSGYSKRVRNVPILQKKSIYSSYTIRYPQPAGAYELDHFIPLSIGGSNDDKNLWPQPAQPIPGFHEKDKVEFYLYNEICAGRISIKAAQEGMRSDWYKVYQSISAPSISSDPDRGV